MNLLMRRRELMIPRASEKPNLAVVTDNILTITEPGRFNYPSGLTANLNVGFQYEIFLNLKFKIDNISSSAANIYIQNAWPHNHWINFVQFRRIFYYSDVGKEYYSTYKAVMSVKRQVKDDDLYLFTIDSSNFIGSIYLSDLTIKEV